MPRESAEVKGLRYLTESRLTILHVDEHRIEALCFGDSAEVYRLGFKPGEWWCECPARTRCAHLTALQRVTLRPSIRIVLAPDVMIGGRP